MFKAVTFFLPLATAGIVLGGCGTEPDPTSAEALAAKIGSSRELRIVEQEPWDVNAEAHKRGISPGQGVTAFVVVSPDRCEIHLPYKNSLRRAASPPPPSGNALSTMEVPRDYPDSAAWKALLEREVQRCNSG